MFLTKAMKRRLRTGIEIDKFTHTARKKRSFDSFEVHSEIFQSNGKVDQMIGRDSNTLKLTNNNSLMHQLYKNTRSHNARTLLKIYSSSRCMYSNMWWTNQNWLESE